MTLRAAARATRPAEGTGARTRQTRRCPCCGQQHPGVAPYSTICLADPGPTNRPLREVVLLWLASGDRTLALGSARWRRVPVHQVEAGMLAALRSERTGAIRRASVRSKQARGGG